MPTIKPLLDYSNEDSFIFKKYIGEKADYDVIFFIGTAVFKPTQENGVGFDRESMQKMGIRNYYFVGSQLTENANVFVPLYRQMALEYDIKNYKKHDDIFNDMAQKEPYVDLEHWLDYYFEHYNKDGQRPFVLAGHSQGGAAVQLVLGKYFINGKHKSYLKNMIAAYSIGYGVSKSRYDSLDKTLDGKQVLHFANGEEDYNCLISWNTEGPDEKGASFLLADEGDTTLVINPLNWKTDETKAGVSENKGALLNSIPTDQLTLENCHEGYHIETQNNLFDAQIDLKRGSVIVTTADPKNYVPNIWGGKSLHVYDGAAYYVNMKENIKKRFKAFKNKK